MAVKTNAQVRTYHRKETVRLEVSFFQDESHLQPITPLNIQLYPSYSIYNKENAVVTSGIGTVVSPGNYYCLWAIPADAPLSSDSQTYRIEWILVDETQRQFNFVEEFNVVDEDVLSADVNSQEYYTLLNRPMRLRYKVRVKPYALKMSMFRGSDESTLLIDNISIDNGKLQLASDDTWSVYYYDAPGTKFDQACNYTVIWDLQQFETAETTYDYQIVHVIPASMLRLIKEVRMMIDKLQKKMNTVQAYQDSDILEYLGRGLELINAWWPTSYYGPQSFPQVLEVFWVLAASWYGLNAQHLLNTELQYNFGGQIDTFEFDHAAGIEAFLSRAMEFLNNNLSKTKQQIFRTTHRVGSVGVRPVSLRRGYGMNMVFKMSSGTFAAPQGNYAVFFGLNG